MTNFKGITQIKKDKANKIKVETDLINDYKNAISIHFNNVISEKDNKGTLVDGKNGFYYMDFITSYSDNLNKQIKSDSALCTIEELEVFNTITTELLIEIVNFFIGIKNYDSENKEVIEGICLSKINIEDGFKKLGQFDIKIQDSSIAMKNYCLKVVTESIYFLYNSIYIDIEKCELKSDFKNLQDNFENSISRKDLDFNQILNSKKTKKVEPVFYDYINNVIDKVAFADELKSTFNIEKGIDFKIMIEILKENEIFSYTSFAGFCESIKKYFDRYIGTRTGLNDLYKHTIDEQKLYSNKIEVIQKKLNPLITNHKKK